MMRPLIDFAFAFAASGAGCAGLALALRVPPAPFGEHMTRRGLRMIGRVIVVLAVIGVGLAVFDGRPAAVMLGALGAWLLAAGAEAKGFAGLIERGGHR